MAITQQELSDLETKVNAQLTAYKAQFSMTMHFAIDRVNDARNNPAITIEELDTVFTKLIELHIISIVALNDGESFNVRCKNSHINMPCAVKKEKAKNGTTTHKNIVITIMRKEKFKAKDAIEFTLS